MTVGMSAPPMGMIDQHADDQRQPANDQRRTARQLREADQADEHADSGEPNMRDVGDVLIACR